MEDPILTVVIPIGQVVAKNSTRMLQALPVKKASALGSLNDG